MARKLTINGPNIQPHQHTVYHDEHGNGTRINYGESIDVEKVFNSADLVKRGIATIQGEPRPPRKGSGGS